MERDEALQSLLVQLAKLQGHSQKELAEQASSQQQCLQLLLNARQQLQVFQVDLCRVREGNDQLAAHNHRLQQEVQQLHSQTQQLQQQLDSKQHMSQQQYEQQSRTAQQSEGLSRMALLSHLATTWHNRTDLACGDSSISSSSSSSKRTSCTSATGSTDTSDVGPLCSSKKLQQSQAGRSLSTSSKPQADWLCSQLHGQPLQQEQQLQQLFPEAEPTHTNEDAAQDVDLQQGHPSCSLPRPAEGLPVVKPEHVFGPVQHASTMQLLLQPLELATAVPTVQQQPAEALATAAVTASDGVVQLTQQQLDYIMAEVEQLQKKLAQTTAKLDAVVAQPITSQSLLPPEPLQQQHHQQQHPQQQGSCVSLQIGGEPISEWHQQPKHKQQQLQHRQQQALELQQPTQQQPQQQQQQQLQRFNHKHRQCAAVNCRRLYQQQHQHQQQQQQLCVSLTQQNHPSKPSWNYQNPHVQQEQRHRRQLQRDAIRLRAQVHLHLHQEHTAAGLQRTQETQPFPLQHQAELQHCSHQQQHNRDSQSLDGVFTAAATAVNINAETLKSRPTAAAAAAAASSCLQLEGSWVSSASSSGHPLAAASAGAGPATGALSISQPGGRPAAASPAERVVFMQPICIRGPGVLHKLHG